MSSQVQTRIDKDLYEDLNKIREETGIPIAESIRRAVSLYIQEYEEYRETRAGETPFLNRYFRYEGDE